MSTIESYQSKMTIFYSKSNGAIKNVVSGVHNMSFYAEEKNDLSIIWDFEVVEYDQFVIYNASQFVFDVSERALKLRNDSSILKYK